MSWSKIWELVKINLLYTNKQQTSMLINKNQKKKARKVAYKRLLFNQISAALFVAVFYSLMLLPYDFSQMPGYFTINLTLFLLIGMLMGFNPLFSVFYDSKDSKLYLPLPVSNKEVLTAKLLSCLPTTYGFSLHMVSMLVFLYMRLTNPVLALILGLVNFLIYLLYTLVPTLYLVYFLGGMISRSRHKKLITGAVMALTTIMAIIAIFIFYTMPMQAFQEAGNPNFLQNLPLIPILSGFYHVVVNPLSLASLVNYWLPLGILIAAIYGLMTKVVPNYNKQLWQIEATQHQTKKKPKKRTTNRSQKQMLISHHINTIKDPTLLMTMFTTPLLMSSMFIGALIGGGFELLAVVSPDFFGTFFLFGGFVATMTITMTSVAISLERENFNFLKTLPFNLKAFLKQKFLLLSFLQLLPASIFYTGAFLFIGIQLPNTLAMLLGTVCFSLIFSEFAYKSDYKHLTLNWQNVTQLFMRTSGGSGMQALKVLAYFLVSFILIGGSAVLSVFMGALPVSIIVVLICLAVFIACHLYLKKSFWDQF